MVLQIMWFSFQWGFQFPCSSFICYSSKSIIHIFFYSTLVIRCNWLKVLFRFLVVIFFWWFCARSNSGIKALFRLSDDYYFSDCYWGRSSTVFERWASFLFSVSFSDSDLVIEFKLLNFGENLWVACQGSDLFLSDLLFNLRFKTFFFWWF